LKTLLQSLGIFRNFIFKLPETDGLRSILDIFRKNIRNLLRKLSKPKNITLVSIDTRQVAKHDRAEFQPATQTDKFLTFFQENSRIFQKNS
jgi:hypothetical protein